MQEIPTRGAFDIEAFEIKGVPHLAVANHFDGESNAVNSSIWRWHSEKHQFLLLQELATRGAADWEFATIAGVPFLVVSNLVDGATHLGRDNHLVAAEVFRWSSGRFRHCQWLPTLGVSDAEFFEVGGASYLAMARYHDDVSHNAESAILRWTGRRFEVVQLLATHGAFDLEVFSVDGSCMLAVANRFNALSYEVNSEIYRWTGQDFRLLQEVPTVRAYSWEFFLFGGVPHLAMANHGKGPATNSTILRWHSDAGRFTVLQTVATNEACRWKAFESRAGVSHLLLVDHRGSSVFRMDGARLRRLGHILLPGLTDWEPFHLDGHLHFALARRYGEDGDHHARSPVIRWRD